MIVGGDALPATFGTGAPQGNYGNLRTRGWELAADYSHKFKNGLRLNFNANIADAISVVTKGVDWKDNWEDRRLSTSYSTGRRYGDIYGFVTDRLYQKEDFMYDEQGKFMQTTIVRDGSSKVTNMLAGNNPVYQTYFEDGNQILLMSPGDVKFVDVNGDGYIDAGKGVNGDTGDMVVIGNSTPRYDLGLGWVRNIKDLICLCFFRESGKEVSGVTVNWLFRAIMLKTEPCLKQLLRIFGKRTVQMHFIQEHGILMDLILAT
ncbi:hypothetical protein OKW96_06570 [Sphingobacterium sp. KU25419]|nr:hypothetical protein OKW96_06570 [Sphingobacterium sp. KU25419]